eukprot:7544452-Alexandrium_andersonii.AAC.1
MILSASSTRAEDMHLQRLMSHASCEAGPHQTLLLKAPPRLFRTTPRDPSLRLVYCALPRTNSQVLRGLRVGGLRAQLAEVAVEPSPKARRLRSVEGPHIKTAHASALD